MGRECCLELSLDLSWLVGFWGFVWFLLGERSTSAPSRDALAAVGYVQTVPDARTAFAFLSAWFCWPRDRRLALGARMVFRAAPILSQPRFEHGTASGCCASSDVDALAVGEQLVQLFLGDCARRGWRERSLRRGRSASANPPCTVEATIGHVQVFEVCERAPLRRDTSGEFVSVQHEDLERRRYFLRQRSCARAIG